MRIVSFASMISIVFMAWMLSALTGCEGQTSASKPAFKAGECIERIVDPKKLESWEKVPEPEITKIVTVGREKYQTKSWYVQVDGTIGIGRWLNSGLTFDDFVFVDKDRFKVVNCPDGTGPGKEITK